MMMLHRTNRAPKKGGIVVLLVVSLILLACLLTRGPDHRLELFAAIRANDAAKVESLLASGANPNEQEQSRPPRNPIEAYYFVFEPHAPDWMQPTPLLAALYSQRAFDSDRNAYLNPNPAIVRALLEYGARPENQTSREPAPIRYAIDSGNTDVVDMLVRRGASVNPMNSVGDRVLVMASKRGLLGMIQYLIVHGADVNAHDAFGRTPLYYSRRPSVTLPRSRRRTLPQAIKLLMDAGAQ
jgi:ankyrin repeat protein